MLLGRASSVHPHLEQLPVVRAVANDVQSGVKRADLPVQVRGVAVVETGACFLVDALVVEEENNAICYDLTLRNE